MTKEMRSLISSVAGIFCVFFIALAMGIAGNDVFGELALASFLVYIFMD
jgi:nicotinamide riboside transporter PnuC